MAAQAEELYSLLIPLHQERLILPRACVAEVVRYAPSGSPAADSPVWFRGFISWQNQQIPVVSVEALAGLEAAAPGGRTRVAILHAIGGHLRGGYFGIMTEGFPQLVRINRDVIQRQDRQAWPADGPVIAQVRLINEYPLIPDLERIEASICRFLDEGEPAERT